MTTDELTQLSVHLTAVVQYIGKMTVHDIVDIELHASTLLEIMTDLNDLQRKIVNALDKEEA